MGLSGRVLAYLLGVMVGYPLLLAALLGWQGTRDPVVAERGRSLAVCLLELGLVAIVVPWLLSAHSGRRPSWRDAGAVAWRTALLLAVSAGAAVVLAGSSKTWAWRPVLAAQLEAASFAILLAGLWMICCAFSRRPAVAQVVASVVGGLMVSTLLWSPVVLEQMSGGPVKRLVIQLMVWANPVLTVAGSAFRWDLSLMPIGYRLGVLASYGFRYPPYLVAALCHAAVGAGLLAVGLAMGSRRRV